MPVRREIPPPLPDLGAVAIENDFARGREGHEGPRRLRGRGEAGHDTSSGWTLPRRGSPGNHPHLRRSHASWRRFMARYGRLLEPARRQPVRLWSNAGISGPLPALGSALRASPVHPKGGRLHRPQRSYGHLHQQPDLGSGSPEMRGLERCRSLRRSQRLRRGPRRRVAAQGPLRTATPPRSIPVALRIGLDSSTQPLQEQRQPLRSGIREL